MKIELEHVYVSYGSKEVLRDVSFTVEEGQIVALEGPSGVGKTTVLRLIAGLLKPARGIVHGGENGAAVVFQDDRLIPHLTAEENLRLVNDALTHDEAVEMLAAVGLEKDAGSRPGELSGGMRRRVAIARAAASGRTPVLLDEPFQGLDGETKQRVMEFVRTFIRGKSTLLVTHDAADAEALGARVIRLERL